MIQKLQDIRNSQNHLLFDLTFGILTALLFSSFIYFEHYATSIKLINTISALLSLALLLYLPKRAILVAGFFIGILWFYWIGYSFKYNGVGYMAPIITLAFAIIYMLFFGVLALTNSVAIRAVLLFALSFFEPMEWNWLQIQLIFVDSYIGLFKYQLIIVLFSLSLTNYVKKSYKYTPLLLIFLAFNFNQPTQKDAPLKIKLVATDIKQDMKWSRDTLTQTIFMIFNEIDSAAKNGYEVVVFPESVFPLFLNEDQTLIDELSLRSYEITIIAGALLNENGVHYNVAYMFKDGKYEIAKKMILVPFGEYIPLPSFAKKFVNDFFFAGASDFKTATKPTDFLINGVKFRNAICYEATTKEIYYGDVDFVIASSNNAWFAPSIEPTLQNLLMKYHARKNGVTIYHSANYRGTGIVK
ncbi:apolipoprotein N-acyltransferase [Sulfurimonas sp.]|uniref:apolipoprotein N-acyltransferase n=1 Tax=Sulfurimonas sp. TaxID=2022749 RepID=UPI0025EBB7B1|nr:apolipoprotein N-acyltransferase [Sulfurimonas sp.]MDD5158129.1 apolipoprotein N-acyltransferase [Sulfurimonas sp.]